MNRAPSTLYRELSHNNNGARYSATRANNQALQRKSGAHSRITLYTIETQELVIKKLREGLSPQQIAHTMDTTQPYVHKVSHEAIYQCIYTARPDLIIYLPRGAKYHNKRKKRTKKQKRTRIRHRISITERVIKAGAFGHWEVDLVGASSRATILIAVERSTRYTPLSKVVNKKACTIERHLLQLLQELPSYALQTITYDNGTENAYHYRVNDILGTKSYFCDPYAAWQKGLVENTIGVLRRYFPKKTKFNTIKKETITKVATILNNKPRKVLGYTTPSAAFRVALNL